MRYRILFTPTAQKDIRKLDAVVKKRIRSKLEYFLASEDPLQFASSLVNSDDGQYRWRVGNYRVVFDVHRHDIVILRVQHRSEVYKNK